MGLWVFASTIQIVPRVVAVCIFGDDSRWDEQTSRPLFFPNTWTSTAMVQLKTVLQKMIDMHEASTS